MVDNDSNYKRTISRLVLGKILSSSSSKWMKSKSYERVSAAFLSSEPEAEFPHISYTIKKPGVSEDQYGWEILNLIMKWIDSRDEINDPEGNVWKSCSLMITPNICSSYGDKEENFFLRIEGLKEISSLIEEIRGMIPGPVRSMILDNSGRIAREERKRYDEACYKIRSIVTSRGANKNLRIKGRCGTLPREIFTANGVTSGSYEITYESGTKRNPVVKRYTVLLPENPLYLATIRRIA